MCCYRQRLGLSQKLALGETLRRCARVTLRYPHPPVFRCHVRRRRHLPLQVSPWTREETTATRCQTQLRCSSALLVCMKTECAKTHFSGFSLGLLERLGQIDFNILGIETHAHLQYLEVF